MTIALDTATLALHQEKSTIFFLPIDVLIIIFREAVYDSGLSTSLETYQAISLSCRWHFQILKDSEISNPIYGFLVEKKLYPKSSPTESIPFIFYQTLWKVDWDFNRQSILQRNPKVYDPLLEWIQGFSTEKKESVTSLEISFLIGNKEKALEVILAFPKISILRIDDERAGASKSQWQLDNETLTKISETCTSLRRVIIKSGWCSMEQLRSIFSADGTVIVLNPPMTF